MQRVLKRLDLKDLNVRKVIYNCGVILKAKITLSEQDKKLSYVLPMFEKYMYSTI